MTDTGEQQEADGSQAPDATGPMGQGPYEVRDGDCINSIAAAHGHFWERIWNDNANVDLRDNRKNADLLLPGDLLTIPLIEEGSFDGATEQRHRFRRKGVPVQLVIRVLTAGRDDRSYTVDPTSNKPWEYNDLSVDSGDPPEPEPEANQPFKLEIDGVLFSGNTDGDGFVRQSIPPGAGTGRLTIRPGQPDERVFELMLGRMNPVTEPIGAAKRLHNLGYWCEISEQWTDSLGAALRQFQVDSELEAHGLLNQATQDALRKAYGS
ncbi:MAG: hypothetical protein ACOYN0_09460 [Phycisphaerales bacterium]